MLRATTACTFSTSQLPKVVRGVHFFISHLASCLRTRRFSEPTFRPSGATNHWKNTVNRDFPTFSRICIFFLLIFSLLTLLTSAFQLSILSEVSLLNFLRPEGNRSTRLMPSIAAVHILTPQQRCCRAQPRRRDVVPENGVSIKGTAWRKVTVVESMCENSGARDILESPSLGVSPSVYWLVLGEGIPIIK